MLSAGGGTTTGKTDGLSLMVGTVYRMMQGCYTPTDLVLSVVEMCVELGLSTHSSSVSLVRMALHRVIVMIMSKATENKMNARIKSFAGTLMVLYWVLGGL